MAKHSKIPHLRKVRTTSKRARKHPVVTTPIPEDRFLCISCDNLTENDDTMHCPDCRVTWELQRRLSVSLSGFQLA